MQKRYKEKPVKVLCNNCKNTVIGIRDTNGLTKIRCPRCGTVTVFSLMGRRHVRLDIYAPQGQEFIDDDDE